MSKGSIGHWCDVLPGLTFLPCQATALNHLLYISIRTSLRQLKLLPTGALQLSCSTSFSSCAYSSGNGTTIHVASRARNQQAIPDSALCPLPAPHQFPHSVLSHGAQPPVPGSCSGEASTCLLPSTFPSHSFPHYSECSFHVEMQAHFRSCSYSKYSVEPIAFRFFVLFCFVLFYFPRVLEDSLVLGTGLEKQGQM